MEGRRDEDRFWMLMEPAWGDSGVGTRGQRALACVTYFVRDLDNGGLDQAIGNREASELDEVCEALLLLGAKDDADLIREAESKLLGDRPPADVESRRAAIDRRPREWLDTHIEPINELLYYEERLYPYFREYIARHPEEFFRE